MLRDFLVRFWVCTLLTLPLLLLSPLIQSALGFHLSFGGDKYVLLILSSVVYFYGGWPFLTGLSAEIKAKNLGMMTLISIAISAAYFYSISVVLGFEGKTFFWELATLIDVMLIGHWLEIKSVLGASRALEALASLLPKYAHLVQNNDIVKVPIEKILENDIILVKPGEKIPIDGVIVSGLSDIHESRLTGESQPVT
jgi:Cu2+-exporting ATPase